SKRDWSSDVCSSDLTNAIFASLLPSVQAYRTSVPFPGRSGLPTAGRRRLGGPAAGIVPLALGPGFAHRRPVEFDDVGRVDEAVRSEERRVEKEWRVA